MKDMPHRKVIGRRDEDGSRGAGGKLDKGREKAGCSKINELFSILSNHRTVLEDLKQSLLYRHSDIQRATYVLLCWRSPASLVPSHYTIALFQLLYNFNRTRMYCKSGTICNVFKGAYP